ncbi:MAG TPA: DUF4097 family beta strand repeat-containing protein [Nocardioidaceae bacterium]|jgi:DUF4097 and DUF4098 domain-containing protein YvlB|nr:DUF4097 family beta strand repeat-containing protein [Nocardioidaceae bacterium]
MSEQWTVAGPRVIEVGGEGDVPKEVRIRLVGGHASVVAQDDLDSVRVEVSAVKGRDLIVTWSHGVLEISHPSLKWENLFEGFRTYFGREDRAEVSVAVPRSVVVRLGTVTGDGLVSGTNLPAHVKTVSGRIIVDGVHGHVDAKTVSGSIEVRDQHGVFTGDTVSGSLTVQAVAMPQLRAKSVSGSLSIDLGTAPATLAATTVSGDVTVRVPADSGFDVDAKTVSGEVVAGGERLAGKPGNNGGRISRGDKAVHLVAKTVSGDVTLLHADAAEGGRA